MARLGGNILTALQSLGKLSARAAKGEEGAAGSFARMIEDAWLVAKLTTVHTRNQDHAPLFAMIGIGRGVFLAILYHVVWLTYGGFDMSARGRQTPGDAWLRPLGGAVQRSPRQSSCGG